MISELFGFNSVLLIESLDTAAGGCSLLLTRVERVALGADFHVDILLRGTGHKRVATVACHSCLIILRMDSFLHDFHLFFFDRELRPGSSAAHPPHVFLTHSPRPFSGRCRSDITAASLPGLSLQVPAVRCFSYL